MAAFLCPIPSSISKFTILREAPSTNKLTEPRITHEFIDAFEDTSYELLTPIWIEYERDRFGYTASFIEANIAIADITKSDARRALEVEILDAFDDWNADESALGRGPREQLAVLKRYIIKKP
jgi:hypothetical protein